VSDDVIAPPGVDLALARKVLQTEAAAILALVERLVKEYKVAAIPGTAFGISRGCSLRVAFGALETATAAEGIGRLVKGLKVIVGK